jgi:glycine/D-amino acid oxidase-like deaminating enzyme
MRSKKIIVIGAGAWGGWSAYMLQKAGYKVTLVDQYGAGNELSGSGGKTRVIRMAYGGDPDYTKMVKRSFDLWREHEHLWNDQLYHETGALWMFGDMKPSYATKSQPLMQELGFSLDEVAIEEVKQRYPQINAAGISKAYWEPKCGYLEAARSCKIVDGKFQELGGVFLQEKITGIRGVGEIKGLETASGKELIADHYIFACGPWITNLFPKIKPYVYASRQEVYYYKSPVKHLAPDLPIWFEFKPSDLSANEAGLMRYGIPDHFDQGFKVAYDEREVAIDPDKDSREVTAETLENISKVIANRFPELKNAELIDHRVCVYDNSMDGEFIMDQAPGYSNGIYLGGSSGHGFKMGPAIGEMVKDQIKNEIPFPAPFKLNRLFEGKKLRSQYQVD